MTCTKCGGLGYIEHVILRDAKEVASVQQCCDISKYSARVMGVDHAKPGADTSVETTIENGNVIALKRK